MKKTPNPRQQDMLTLNKMLRRRGVKIEWRPLLGVFDVFRYCDATAPSWDTKAFMVTTPKLRTDDWFEVCCYGLSGNRRPK